MSEVKAPIADTGEGKESTHPSFGTVTAPIGRVVSVSGSEAIVMLEPTATDGVSEGSIRADMGALLRVKTPSTIVIGMVSGLSVPIPEKDPKAVEIKVAELELLGEFQRNPDGTLGEFRRGVSTFPALGDAVFPITTDDLRRVYTSQRGSSIRLGSIHQDRNIPAHVVTDQLLGKHFAVLGTTGSGKSCSVALILRSILEKHPNAHMLLLDPHNEYYRTFEDIAEIINPDNLQLPYWLLTFEEISEILTAPNGTRDQEAEILHELVPLAKRRYATHVLNAEDGRLRKPKSVGHITVDTPVPYRMSDIVTMIDDVMGRLSKPQNLTPYRRLKNRIETISTDARYGFMFGGLTVRDNMKEILARIFRIPVNKKPITIMDLSGIPSEILNVVVSVLSRMTFDLALWSGRSVPIHLICEEAHRYVPQDAGLGFEPTKHSISRIAKEGRKYGVSLGIVSQRPAELDPTILSQCNTIFALRMTNSKDQEFVNAAVTDSARGLLSFLPSLADAEAIAVGEGVSLPMRIKFDRLPNDRVPRSMSTRFSEQWNTDVRSDTFLENVVERWRAQRR
ncbi:MAG: DUF87 domain-containing protein [Pseudomonadota bacterium]